MAKLPTKLREIVTRKLSTNFREATEIVETAIPKLEPKQILVKNRFLGINASDINFTSGRYDATQKPPFPVGFEAIGQVIDAGGESPIKSGQSILYTKMGAFKDYVVIDSQTAVPIPVCDPAFLSLNVSGLTASIALEKEADLKPGKVVLVTAAAGGTGQFAVQLAKLAGCHVIGTCSSKSKADFLKSIGCDRTVNYNEESLTNVLTKEYEKGVDVVYESIGGEMFDAALQNLATNGRLIVIGSISAYQTEREGLSKIEHGGKVPIPMTLLSKSASVRGFFLMHYGADIPRHLGLLIKLYMEKKLKVVTDNGQSVATGPFMGLDKVPEAIDYMYLKKNIGKIVVEINKEEKSGL